MSQLTGAKRCGSQWSGGSESIFSRSANLRLQNYLSRTEVHPPKTLGLSSLVVFLGVGLGGGAPYGRGTHVQGYLAYKKMPTP